MRLTGETAEGIAVTSYVLLYRARADAAPEIISCERNDILREADGSLRLARRLVLLDHTYLPTENMAAFL